MDTLINKNGVPGQGPETPQLKEAPPIETIEKWVKDDITRCMNLLNALATDKELRLHLATFMQGRLTNHLNRPTDAPLSN